MRTYTRYPRPSGSIAMGLVRPGGRVDGFVPVARYDLPMSVRDLIIVGAGPSGLATAIAAGQAGLDYTVIEKGVLVNSIYQFPVHMSFFTTPELLEIGGVPLVTPYEKPTRIEALRYYRRVAEKFDLGIEFGRQVTGLRP